MSDPTAGGTPVNTGVLATWRATSRVQRALLLGIFINKLGGFLQVFLVLFLTARGFSHVQAGLALGVYSSGSVVGVLVGGWVSDAIGVRATIVSSMIACAALLVAIPYASSYTLLLCVVAVVGAVGQFYRPASAVLLAELTAPQRQVMVFAMSRLALNLGTTAAPILGAALVTVSYNLLFWCEATVSLLFALFILIALEPRATVHTPRPAHAVAAPFADRPAMREPRAGYLAVLPDRHFVAYLVATFLNAAVYAQYLSTLPLTTRDRGLSPTWYSLVVSLNGVVVITTELAITRVVSQWPGRRVLLVGFILLGSGLALYAPDAGPWLLVVGTLLWSLAEIIEGPTMFAYPAQAGPPALRGRYVASAQAMFSIGTAIAPVIGVIAYQALGARVWLIIGLTSVATLAPGLYGMRPDLARPRTPADVNSA